MQDITNASRSVVEPFRGNNSVFNAMYVYLPCIQSWKWLYKHRGNSLLRRVMKQVTNVFPGAQIKRNERWHEPRLALIVISLVVISQLPLVKDFSLYKAPYPPYGLDQRQAWRHTVVFQGTTGTRLRESDHSDINELLHLGKDPKSPDTEPSFERLTTGGFSRSLLSLKLSPTIKLCICSFI